MFLDILKPSGANFDWNQTLSGFGLGPPNISPNPEKVGVLVASEGSCAARHCRGCKNTRPSSASSGMVITTTGHFLEVAQQFGNLKKGTINDTSRRFTITEEESRTTAVAQPQITA